MKDTATIDRAGRVVIPKLLRDALHLEAGDTLEVETEGESITLRPKRAGASVQKERGVWVFRAGGAPPSSDHVERARLPLAHPLRRPVRTPYPPRWCSTRAGPARAAPRRAAHARGALSDLVVVRDTCSSRTVRSPGLGRSTRHRTPRALQLTILALERGEPLYIAAARTGPRTGVLLRLQQPPPERLFRASALRGDRRDGGPVGRMVRQRLADQSDGPFTNLGLKRDRIAALGFSP